MVFLALGLVYWLTVARIVRGQVLSLKEQDFIKSARALGASDLRIIFRHILPNLSGIIMVYLTLTIPRLMLQESFLSFLGLEIRGQEHSWGAILNEAVISSAGTDWWMIVFPGGVMFLTLFSITILGETLEKRVTGT
jgi:oligopeptide transport system permease protein